MVVLLSTYELGRPAFGVASAAAWLRDAGHEVHTVDLSRAPLSESLLREATAFAVHVPMHAATRLAGPVLARLRDARPAALRIVFGLYAPLNDAWLRAHGATHVLGVEAEADLVLAVAGRLPGPSTIRSGHDLPRLAFKVPDRTSQAPLSAYARLHAGDGDARLAGYTEATRGCKHTCAHCPIVPVYQGTFRVVPVDVVMRDIDQQVAAGARHITFGDPDFLNGPAHARRVIEALATRHPDVTFDVTIKVEHLLAHPELLDLLASTRCAFVTSAVESFDADVLQHLRKRHTPADAREAIARCRARGLALVPTFVAFTPWTTPASYLGLLDDLRALDLVEVVAPVQLALRLLLPAGSPLLAHADVARVTRGFDEEALAYPWTHEDPRMDALQQAVMASVARGGRTARRSVTYDAVRALAGDAAGLPAMAFAPGEVPVRATVPYLDEPWYC